MYAIYDVNQTYSIFIIPKILFEIQKMHSTICEIRDAATHGRKPTMLTNSPRVSFRITKNLSEYDHCNFPEYSGIITANLIITAKKITIAPYLEDCA